MAVDDRDYRCPECNQVTQEGREKILRNCLEHPANKTDFTKPLSQLLEEIRGQLHEARNKIRDILAVDTPLKERIKPTEGLLTCGLVALSVEVVEAKRYERALKQRGEVPSIQLPKKELVFKGGPQ